MFNQENFYLPKSKKYIQNPLLVKAEVGKTKRPTRDLPKSGFRYGSTRPHGIKEGAGEVILNWNTHTANEAAKPGKDFVQMNKKAVQCGHTTARAIAKFHKSNFIAKKVGQSQKIKGHNNGSKNDETRHGVKTVRLDNVEQLIVGQYQKNWLLDQKSYLAAIEKKKIVTKQVVQKTKASEGHKRGADIYREIANRDPLIIERRADIYSDVEPRVVTMRSPKNGSQAGCEHESAVAATETVARDATNAEETVTAGEQ